MERHGIEIRSQLEAQQSKDALDDLKDENWLREQYVENQRSTTDIANGIGVPNTAVGDWLRRHGIETRSMAEAHLPEGVIDKLEDEDWMYEQYVENRRSSTDIASELGVGQSTIISWLKRSGIEIRSTSEAKLSKFAFAKLQNDEWLFHQYIELGETTASIADELDIHPKTVVNWLKNTESKYSQGFKTPNTWIMSFDPDGKWKLLNCYKTTTFLMNMKG